MGVLPLEFDPGTTRQTLRLDGNEVYSLENLEGAPAPGTSLTLAIERRNGTITRVPVCCRIDTDEERAIIAAGGLLPRIREALGTRAR
jgi:aconitate hydratase